MRNSSNAKIDTKIGEGPVNGLLPMEFALMQNYPNPFNPATRIRYQLPQESKVGLVVYNSVGQVVRTLVNSDLNAGYHEVVWDGLNSHGQRVTSGIYFYRIKAGDFTQTHKMLLMK